MKEICHGYNQAYCYSDTCPKRTEKEPWPWGTILFKGQRGKKALCPYCGNKLQRVLNKDISGEYCC
jgi:hypothetical protein